MASASASADHLPAPPPPPPLDRSSFDRTIVVVGVRVPCAATSAAMKACAEAILKLPRVKTAVPDPASPATHRVVLLDPAVVPGLDLAGLGAAAVAAIAALGGTAVSHNVLVGYEHATLEDVLRASLPASFVGALPSSFETAGHVAHLNLRDDLLPYKAIIGRAILDKNPCLRTVVNKTGAINAQFRTFPMEVLAGEDDTRVEVRETGARFRFDFRDVYWNSRLGHEHEHMAGGGSTAIPRGAVVADMFCGVGPFAIPLALPGKACTVYANDLNPASHAALVANVGLNRVGGRVTCYCLDARDFIRAVVRGERRPIAHVLMNLPADALDFTDAFVGLYSPEGEGGDVVVADASPAAGSSSSGGSGSGSNSGVSSSGVADPAAVTGVAGVTSAAATAAAAPPQRRLLSSLPMPRVHVYCFSKNADKEAAAEDVVARLLARLQLPAPPAAVMARAGGAAAVAVDVVDDDAESGALSGDAVGSGSGAAASSSSSIAAVTGAVGAVQSFAKRWMPDLEVRSIRDVAPKKLMMCVSFTLPDVVARGRLGGSTEAVGQAGVALEPPAAKRVRVEV